MLVLFLNPAISPSVSYFVLSIRFVLFIMHIMCRYGLLLVLITVLSMAFFNSSFSDKSSSFHHIIEQISSLLYKKNKRKINDKKE